MMGFPRTMYKLLTIALAIHAAALALDMAAQILNILAISRQGLGGGLSFGVSIVFLCGRFLLALTALYWIPKFVRKVFPEVSQNALP